MGEFLKSVIIVEENVAIVVIKPSYGAFTCIIVGINIVL